MRVMIVKRKNLFLSIILLVTLSLVFGGCTVTEKRTGAGAGIGAGVGAAAGAIIGALTGSPELGAAIGAVAGGIGGAIIGSQMGEAKEDDTEKMKKLSGLIMNAEKLNENMAFIGVSPETKNAIMVDVGTVLKNAPDAMFTVNMHGQVIRQS